MKNTLSQVGVVLVVAALVIGWQQVRIHKLEEELKTALSAPPPAKAVEARPIGRVMPRKPANEGKSNVTAAEQAKPAAGAPSNEVVQPPAAGGMDAEKLREMMKSPAMRSMMAQQMKTMTASLYKPLIEKFGLTDEEREHFQQLIGDSLLAQQDLGLAMMGAKTPEERAAIQKQITQAGEDLKGKIREFLNDEGDYQAYVAYQDSLPERQQMMGLKPMLEANSTPLTAEQEEKLVDVMHKARSTTLPTEQWGDGRTPGEAIFSDDAVERFDRDWTRMSEAVLKDSSEFLDEKQQKTLGEYQDQMRGMQKMGIEMARTMFRPPAAGK